MRTCTRNGQKINLKTMYKKIKIKKLSIIFTTEKVKRRSTSDQCRNLERDKKDKLKRKIVLERGNRCEICGRSGNDADGLTLYHINAYTDGGAWSKSNMILCCRKCHNDLHNNPIFALSVYHKRESAYSLKQLQEKSEQLLKKSIL